MEGLGLFATQERSDWGQRMLKANRYPGDCWMNKALGILERGDIDFGDITPTAPEIGERIAEMIGPPPSKDKMPKVVYFAQQRGFLTKTGTKRKSHEGRPAFLEYNLGK